MQEAPPSVVPECQWLAPICTVLGWWQQLPDGIRDFAIGDLPSWLALAVALAIAFLFRKVPSTISFNPHRWRATRQPDMIEIGGTVHIAPVGSSFIITDLAAKVRLDGAGPFRVDSEQQRDILHCAMDGAHQVNLTYRLRDLDPKSYGAAEVELDIRVKLADGAKASTKLKLPIAQLRAE